MNALGRLVGSALRGSTVRIEATQRFEHDLRTIDA